jgi:hypothetical protein
MRARLAAGQPARPAGGQASLSVLVPTFSERETGQSGGCRQRLGRAVEQVAGSWRRRGDSSGTWIKGYRSGGGNGRPRGQRPHAGANRESPGRAGRPCAAVRCTPGSPRSSPALTDSTHKPPPSVSTGHSVASTNRHRIPVGWNPMPAAGKRQGPAPPCRPVGDGVGVTGHAGAGWDHRLLGC